MPVAVRSRAAGHGGPLSSRDFWCQEKAGAENPGKGSQGLRGELIRIASEEKESKGALASAVGEEEGAPYLRISVSARPLGQEVGQGGEGFDW